MKKLLIFIIACVLLTGCSAKSAAVNGPKTDITGVTGGTEASSAISQNQSGSSQGTQTQASDSQISREDEGWFTGAIGTSKIHAKLDISGNDISGVYYYDKYKSNIKLEGNLENEVKDYRTICLNEDTSKDGEFYGILKTPDYMEGYWREGEKMYPMYLIKSGSGIKLPLQPDAAARQFDGSWMGSKSNYYIASYVEIQVLFKDLLYYDLESNNGANLGSLTGLALIDQEKAEAKLSDEASGDAYFNFNVNGGKLKLESDNYSYMCGAGVSHMADYVKGEIDIPVPDPQEVGIVDTREQADKFRSMVGDMYEEFISLTQATSEEEYILDGNKVSVRRSFLRGLADECIYIVSDKHLYAAAVSETGIEYFTDDAVYADKLPDPIKKWADDKSELNINYNAR